MRLRTPERSLMAALPLRHRLSDTCRSSSSSSRGDNGQAQAQEQQERGHGRVSMLCNASVPAVQCALWETGACQLLVGLNTSGLLLLLMSCSTRFLGWEHRPPVLHQNSCSRQAQHLQAMWLLCAGA